MRCAYRITSGLLPCLFFLLGQVDTCVAQYLPYGAGRVYGSWNAYPGLNAGAAQRTLYSNQQANMRQAVRESALQHQQQNEFLLQRSQTMSRGGDAGRAGAENFIMQNRPAPPVAARSYAPPAPAAGLPVTPRAPTPVTAQPHSTAQSQPAETLVKWPTLLMDSRFLVPRVQIETLLRRTLPGGSGLTETSREDMRKMVADMKRSLRAMASDVNAAEYLAIDKYLDDLAAKTETVGREVPPAK